MQEGREDDLDVVVGVDFIAVGEFVVDAAVRFEGADAEIHRARRIPDKNFSGVFGGETIERGVFGESGEQRGALPDGIVERAVDCDAGVDARNFHGGLAGAAAVNGWRRIVCVDGWCDSEKGRERGHYDG